MSVGFWQRGHPGPSRIPKRWEDVTPAWMTAAIASRHPDALVADVALLEKDDGTNRRARFGLTYAQGTGPARVFLKAHAASHRWVHFRNGNLFGEARLFRSGATLSVEHPAVYSAIVDLPRLDFLLVMEDLTLRGADPLDATRPMTPAQVVDGLRGLAKLHSRYWNFSAPSHPELRFVQTWKDRKGWTVGLNKRVPTGLDRGRGSLPNEILQYSGTEIVGFWSRYVASLAVGTTTLLHGDAHIGNTYLLPNNGVGFLDWQVVRRGEWSQDAGYFLVSALTEKDRRAHEKSLIEEYRQALDVPDAQRPSAAEAWLRYRASAAYGLAIWLSTLGTDGYQRREVSLALAKRFTAAFLELGTLNALGG
ncbi:MAG TPA: phosphotransferase [Acetobacteraceae bacterium]|nr:phosphotransferase [Acetobacteraceae bacterium]